MNRPISRHFAAALLGLAGPAFGLLASSFSSASVWAQTTTPASAPASTAAAADDPYLWLEAFDSPRAMDWVRSENAKTLGVLENDPHFQPFLKQALDIAQNHDRIPAPRQIAGRVYNFWQDPDHVRGLWRRAEPADYDAGGTPHWQPVLDLDQLSTAEHANWVWQGADCEPLAERRCLVLLSDGGEDASTVREFDLVQRAFVPGGFALARGKQRVAWLDKDTLLVAREWKPGELTASSYPYIVKRLKRGQPLADAVEVFRGQQGDGGYGVSPQVLTDAQGHRAVLISRPLSTFEAETYLLTAAGPQRLALPLKAEVEDLFDGQLLVRLREDWTAGPTTLHQGSLVAIPLAQATAHPDALQATLVFAPGERQALEAVASTRDALVVTTLDNVRGRASLYTRRRDGQWSSTPLALPENTTVGISDASPRSKAVYLSVAGYLQPSSLWRVTLARPQPVRVRSLPALFDASNDEVEQFQASSTDGTKIPYFIVHPKQMALDGSHPTILYA